MLGTDDIQNSIWKRTGTGKTIPKSNVNKLSAAITWEFHLKR